MTYRFDCLKCEHRIEQTRPLDKCPACGAGGFDLMHTGDIVESDGLPVPKSRRVRFAK